MEEFYSIGRQGKGLKNFFGPHHADYPNGVGGRPVNFITVPDTQPPGSLYRTIGNGLMEDIRIFKTE